MMKGASPSQYGKSKRQKAEEKRAAKHGGVLPIKDYETLDVGQIVEKLDGLSSRDLKKMHDYERSHKNRKPLLERMRGYAAD